jgi:hypothetical protein
VKKSMMNRKKKKKNESGITSTTNGLMISTIKTTFSLEISLSPKMLMIVINRTKPILIAQV